MDTKRGCVSRYEERLTQQESGVASSKSSKYLSGRLLYQVCINWNRWIALHIGAICFTQVGETSNVSIIITYM